MISRARFALPLVALCALGCVNPPPIVVEAAVVSDTTSEQGPYEVRAIVMDDDELRGSTLTYVVVRADGLTARAAESLPLVVDDRIGGAPGIDGARRLRAAIPGQALGSIVRWALDVCDAQQACTSFPASGASDRDIDGADADFEFIVGLVPSTPSIERVDPDVGPASGGTRVEIHGADLRPGVIVRFGDDDAPHVEWLREDLVAVQTPAHEVGVVDVSVENPDGAVATLEDAFTFVPSPIVVSVSPTSGPEVGGTSVVIEAEELRDEARAFFDGVACRRQRVLVDTLPARIECDTPPGTGLVDVEIRDPERGFGLLADAFTYIPAPKVDAVQPDEGNSDGGDLIVVSGQDFSEDATVFIDGVQCADVQFVSAEELTCLTSPGEPGVADVVVENGDGQRGTLPGGFALLGPPIVVEVLPGESPVAGGIEVRVLGAGLHESDEVTFGGATGVVVDSVGAEELVVLVPPVPADLDPAPLTGLLAVDVTVTRTDVDDDRSGTLPAGLVYFWPPEIDDVTPARGRAQGGTDVVITGRFFRVIAGETFVVSFDREGVLVECIDVDVVSSTSIRCTTPAHTPGIADVVIENHPLSTGVGDDLYTFVGPPRVDSVEPPEGPTFGGEDVIVRGDFFEEGAVVLVGGAVCSDADVVSPQEIRCVSPPGEVGPADVQVTNVDGQSATAPSSYAYLGVAVTPNHGLPAGFARVRVRSAGIDAAAVVRFGNVVAQCTFVTSREMSCQSPPGTSGAVDVSFSNPNGTGETGDGAFDYRTFTTRPNVLVSDGVNPDNGDDRRNNANHVEVFDVDLDLDLDIAVAQGRVSNTEVSVVFENDSASELVAASFDRRDLTDVDASANKISVGDVDGDGRLDMLFAASNGVGAILVRNTSSAGGAVDFTPVDLGLPQQSSAFDALLADLVGDERLDVFVQKIGCDPVLDVMQPDCDNDVSGPDVLLEQTGNLTFADRSGLVPHEDDWDHDHKVIGVDLERDGDIDLVVVTNNASFFTEENRILRNRVDEGLGFVAEVPTSLQDIVGDLYDIDAGDIDGDGDQDIVTTNCGNSVPFDEAILVNDDGDLVRDDGALPGGVGDACVVGTLLVDIEGDGDLDVFFGGTRSIGDTRISGRVYVNDGTGTFHDASDALTLGDARLQINNFAAGDLDGDGDVDVVAATGAPYTESFRPGAVIVLELE